MICLQSSRLSGINVTHQADDITRVALSDLTQLPQSCTEEMIQVFLQTACKMEWTGPYNTQIVYWYEVTIHTQHNTARNQLPKASQSTLGYL